jgi:hypothetical protein
MASARVPEMRKQLRELEARLEMVMQQLDQLTNPVVEA